MSRFPAKLRLTLWCEHSRLPLSVLNGEGNREDRVYDLLPPEWLVKSVPVLKLLMGTLGLILPVASSAMRLMLDKAAYKGIEEQLDLGQKTCEVMEKAVGWLGHDDNAPHPEQGTATEAQGAALRELQVWLKEQAPGFGELIRVQNKRQEFLWVHPQFENEH